MTYFRGLHLFTVSCRGVLEEIMRWFKRIGIALLLLPFVLISGIIVFEIFDICVNHAATDRQTKKLQTDLESRISDLEILNVHSETGNLSGTGNHVECLSVIDFATEMTEGEITSALSDTCDLNRDGISIEQKEDGTYTVYLETSAPFPDNIEGH